LFNKNSMHTYAVDLIDSDDENIVVELKPNQAIGQDKQSDPHDVERLQKIAQDIANRHRSLHAVKTTPEYTSHDQGTCLPPAEGDPGLWRVKVKVYFSTVLPICTSASFLLSGGLRTYHRIGRSREGVKS
jgi:hypothetical protein